MRPIRYSTFVKQASLIKTRLTGLDTQVSSLNPAELTESIISRIKVIDETAIKKNAEFETLVGKLFSSDPPVEEEIKENEVVAFQEAISDLYIKIHSTCMLLIPSADSNLNQSTDSSTSVQRTHEPLGIRLPPLNLGVFTGQLDKWIAFYSLFDSTVNKNNNLSDVEKFTYLLSSLNGEPLNLIKSLPVTTANYHIAWQQLVKRYNNSRLLVTNHVHNILNLPSVHDCSVSQLRSFISAFHENSSALKALHHDVTNESLFLTSYLLGKFDLDFRAKFEHSRADSQLVPTINEFIDFIEKECSHLEAADICPAFSRHSTSTRKLNTRQKLTSNPANQQNVRTALLSAANNATCVYCNSNEHTVYRCSNFSALTPEKRLKFVQEHSLCNNCLGRHNVRKCNSQHSCNVCKRRHHTLLHNNGQMSQPQTYKSNLTNSSKPSTAWKVNATLQNQSKKEEAQNITSTASTTIRENSTTMVGLSSSSNNVILLGTALVHLSNPHGNSTVARAILDSAAQQTILTQACAQELGILHSRSKTQNILGISSSIVPTKGLCQINISSLSGKVLAENHPVLVLETITSHLPHCQISHEVKECMRNLVLADPTFDTPAPIDILIGADLFAHTLKGETLSLGPDMPTALNTIFGYVLIGSAPIYSPISNVSINLLTVTDIDLHNAIQRFWCSENIPNTSTLSLEDQQCEKHFVDTHCRLEDGKYQVRLPLKQDPSTLGKSSEIALNIFKSLEKRLSRNPDIKKKYVEFMQDYYDSGHMTTCDPQLLTGQPQYFLPHHEVIRDDKIRVVFNASSITSTGLSLNNILHPGPKLHNDIPAIIFSFRRHRIVFTCDIKQMFRNIWINPEDRNLQLIYWRQDPSHPLQILKLNTVTYGMTSSPFLANRVIQQLIEDETCHHPIAAAALRDQIYVDDALLGSDTLEDALRLQQDVIEMMKKGGFLLRKWTSNCSDILEAVPSEYRGTPLKFYSSNETLCNVLGLKWLPEADSFSYIVSTPQLQFTKRSVLSAIAHLYDPMGWISPVTFWAKTLMQILWTKGLQWDDPLPSDLLPNWNKFLQELTLLEKLLIPRHVDTSLAQSVQLHGFCDASEAGFCASVILRVQNSESKISTYLIIAKSRVAPLKRVSLPRLELCGAHLLSKLLQYCVNLLSSYLFIDQVFAWCDSTIVLSWIHTPAYRLKTYVANRVSEIQDISIPVTWSHIASEQNPADCGSRGIYPSIIINHPLWWNGPTWLLSPQINWTPYKFTASPSESLPELKPSLSTMLHATTISASEILNRFSSWTRLTHVIAYILRFVHCCRDKISQRKSRHESSATQKSLPSKYPSYLEIRYATIYICLLVQKEQFQTEINSLQKNEPCSTRINRLSPFLDTDGLIRVGGRLRNASIDYSAKHPILLPKKHHVVNLIIDHYHRLYMHAGPQQMQSLLSQKFWILSARGIIRSRVFRCITCFRNKPNITTPFMGDLPQRRVQPSRPFDSSGCDYAGPFLVRLYRQRKLSSIKVYLCIFICLATKAVHLETVTDLTSEAFIAALTRFISRRGLISHLHTDCGTSFVGAARKLRQEFEALCKNPATQNFAENRSISFHFLPPRAPHQGGLWERAVKSAKHHLKRVIGDQILTLEEFMTLSTRIEAMLNSRPLTPLSSDPSELDVLTPGHFLAGGPLVSTVEQNLDDVPINRLHRWQLVQSFTQCIWKRWTKEYLHTLQQRSKWTRVTDNLKIGQLVVIHEDNTPPLKWKMGRVVKVYPGKDNIVRVADLATSSGLLSRPVVKLSPLPLD